MYEVNFRVSFRSSTRWMDVQPAKVLAELQSLRNGKTGKVLVMKDCEVALNRLSLSALGDGKTYLLPSFAP